MMDRNNNCQLILNQVLSSLISSYSNNDNNTYQVEMPSASDDNEDFGRGIFCS